MNDIHSGKDDWFIQKHKKNTSNPFLNFPGFQKLIKSIINNFKFEKR